MINKYFKEIENSISSFSNFIKTYSKTEKLYSENKGYVRGKIVFTDNCMLIFMELIDIEKQAKQKYSYHFVDSDTNLIFRYDNSEHHPDISSYPHHKHLPGDVILSNEPKLSDILIEIYNMKYRKYK